MPARRIFKTRARTNAELQARHRAKKKREAAEAAVMGRRERAAALRLRGSHYASVSAS